jgi:hypothetical protein
MGSGRRSAKCRSAECRSAGCRKKWQSAGKKAMGNGQLAMGEEVPKRRSAGKRWRSAEALAGGAACDGVATFLASWP